MDINSEGIFDLEEFPAGTLLVDTKDGNIRQTVNMEIEKKKLGLYLDKIEFLVKNDYEEEVFERLRNRSVGKCVILDQRDISEKLTGLNGFGKTFVINIGSQLQ
jgi:hypothetical protein